MADSMKISVEGINMAKKRVATQSAEYERKIDKFVNNLVDEHNATEVSVMNGAGIEAGLTHGSSSSLTPSKAAAAGFSLVATTAASSAAGAKKSKLDLADEILYSGGSKQLVTNHNHSSNRDGAAARTIQAGPNSLWSKYAGVVEPAMLEGTSAKLLLNEYVFKANESKSVQLVSDPVDEKKNQDTAIDAELGPALNMPFKPLFWRQFGKATHAQQHVDTLRKGALRQRHMSTVIAAPLGLDYGSVSSGSESESDSQERSEEEEDEESVSTGYSSEDDEDAHNYGGEGEGGEKVWHGMNMKKSRLAIEPPLRTEEILRHAEDLDLATGKMVTFVDLLKSISVFQHLTDDELYELGDACAGKSKSRSKSKTDV